MSQTSGNVGNIRIATWNTTKGLKLNSKDADGRLVMAHLLNKMKVDPEKAIHILGIGQTHWMGEGVFGVQNSALAKDTKQGVKLESAETPDTESKIGTLAKDTKQGVKLESADTPDTESKIGTLAEDSKQVIIDNCDYFIVHCGDSDTAWRGVAIVVAKELHHCIQSWDIVSSRIVSVDLKLQHKQETALVTVIQVYAPRSDNVLSQHTEFWDMLNWHVSSKLPKRSVIIMGDILEYAFKVDGSNNVKCKNERDYTSEKLKNFLIWKLEAKGQPEVWAPDDDTKGKRKKKYNFLITIASPQISSLAPTEVTKLSDDERSLKAVIPFQIGAVAPTATVTDQAMRIAFRYHAEEKLTEVALPPTTIADNQPTALHSSVYDNEGKFLCNSTDFLEHIQQTCVQKFPRPALCSASDFSRTVPSTVSDVDWNKVESNLLKGLSQFGSKTNTLDLEKRQVLSQIRCLLTQVVTPVLRMPKQCKDGGDLQLDFPPVEPEMKDVFNLISMLLGKDIAKQEVLKLFLGESFKLIESEDDLPNSGFHIHVSVSRHCKMAIQWGGVIIGTLSVKLPKLPPLGGHHFLLHSLLNEWHLGANWKGCGAKVDGDTVEFYTEKKNETVLEALKSDLDELNRSRQIPGISLTVKTVTKRG